LERKLLPVAGTTSEYKNSLFLYVLLEFIRAHAKEFNQDVLPEPLLFLKPTTSYLKEGGSIIVSAFNAAF